MSASAQSKIPGGKRPSEFNSGIGMVPATRLGTTKANLKIAVVITFHFSQQRSGRSRDVLRMG